MAYFSIILPTYNRAHLIRTPIISIINQSFGDWELIVVDDGSIDNTREVTNSFKEPRLKYIFQKNQERSAARNAGIVAANGAYICFIDSDDRWHNNHLEVIYKSIAGQKGRPALYFTSMNWDFGTHKEAVIFESPEGRNAVEYVLKNQIAPSTVCLPHKIVTDFKFNAMLRINEDVELFARIASKYPLIQIPKVTIDLIVHEENTKGQTKDYVQPQIEVMQMIFESPLLKDKISAALKKNVFKNLRHQHINHFLSTGNYGKMNREIVTYLLLYPFDKGNKTKLVNLIYHLPGGNMIKSIFQTLKNNNA